MSAVQSLRLRPVNARRVFLMTSDVRTQLFRKRQRQLIPPVLRWLMSSVHSRSLSVERRTTSILRYEWCQNLTFQKVPETTYTSCFKMSFISLVTFWKFESCTTPNQYSPLSVTWVFNFSERAGDNWHLLACDDFDDSCTFCKFKSCRTLN